MAGEALAYNDALTHNRIMSQIKDALTALRRTMSQAEIARAIGVNQSRISRWEKGEVASGAEAAIKLLELAEAKAADEAAPQEAA